MVQGYVRGLQGDDPRYVRANAGCKHFDVHAGPENIPVSRVLFDAKVDYNVERNSQQISTFRFDPYNLR